MGEYPWRAAITRPPSEEENKQSEVGVGTSRCEPSMLRMPLWARPYPRQCGLPSTDAKGGHAIYTGIDICRADFDAAPVFFSQTFCPLCRTHHEWFARDRLGFRATEQWT
jgi:hypothetical protein